MAAYVLQNKAKPATNCKRKQGRNRADYLFPQHVVLGFAPLLGTTVSGLLRHDFEFNVSEIIEMLCCNPSGAQFNNMTRPGCAACRQESPEGTKSAGKILEDLHRVEMPSLAQFCP